MEGKIAKLSVFPESGDVGYGDESDVVAIIQIMLNTLKLRYDGYDFLKVTFLFDDATEDAVRHFQGVNSMETSGRVDRKTWNALADEFYGVVLFCPKRSRSIRFRIRLGRFFVFQKNEKVRKNQIE